MMLVIEVKVIGVVVVVEVVIKVMMMGIGCGINVGAQVTWLAAADEKELVDIGYITTVDVVEYMIDVIAARTRRP